ncbi:MAG: GNAT family N-acetyltransferase [Actinobacteria bacterium]|nr:GNAT family N-acetyltransferase [Actinomycetota bacterium]MCI0543941.1 GNAT family N-acetyltransferase [Actinomycetota bacterium]MCI0678518.1 GNAT family N-acetyltransferase [Actinomycetota bacterium]
MTLAVEGVWPGPMTITRGWAKAMGRRWNDESEAGYLRLLRGGPDFLVEATHHLAGTGDGVVYSPALHTTATRVWRRAGYRVCDNLMVMERSLSRPWRPVSGVSEPAPKPDWPAIDDVDRTAFTGFWRMGVTGLVESAAAARRSIVFTTSENGAIVGFSIVGTDGDVGYLQRIAVGETHTRRGIGSDLLAASLDWARRQGSQNMLLNVRTEAEAALGLYRSFGFIETRTRLEILVYGKADGPC